MYLSIEHHGDLAPWYFESLRESNHGCILIYPGRFFLKFPEVMLREQHGLNSSLYFSEPKWRCQL
jgi:hypothetical protein